MTPRVLNTSYWTQLPVEKIIGDNATPGKELFERLAPRARVLDVGCGKGSLAESLAVRGYDVTGLDLNIEAVQNGQKRKSAVKYLVGDVLKGLLFEDAAFDAIVLSFVLVNIIPESERKKAVQELSRVLKPGGVIWVNEGTISEGYQHCYEICLSYVGEERSFFVYTDKHLSQEIHTPDQLAQAIAEQKIARIAHHFTDEEIRQLFYGFKEVSYQASQTQSPNSQTLINMSTFVFEKR